MNVVTAEAAQAYVDRYYLTLEMLVERTGVTAARIDELAEAGCIPPHTYELRGDVVFASAFGENRLPSQPRRYYHHGEVEWVKKANALAQDHALAEVARIMREGFDREVADALDGREVRWSADWDHPWNYLMDGSWSLCLKELSASHLAGKEVARATIARIANADPDHEIDESERAELEAAVAQYDRVALPFAPHEVGVSSRRLEVGAAIEKYRLATDI
jgi:hypothetical protein